MITYKVNMNNTENNNLYLPANLLSLSDSVICKVEVDLAGWLEDLSGVKGWEIWSELENENSISFLLKLENDNAEVILYTSGYAIVDINGESVFNGDLIEKRALGAKLSYYRADDGEKILLH